MIISFFHKYYRKCTTKWAYQTYWNVDENISDIYDGKYDDTDPNYFYHFDNDLLYFQQATLDMTRDGNGWPKRSALGRLQPSIVDTQKQILKKINTLLLQ
ncbi:hypothetical protein RhiirA4_467832 [Rhizophagus irregularis]|uniref:Uncharacterized protein n=1 Tax=Rhizophagus irregularis TaxID=588596 RepID=A0A2I1GWL8_9GLOM|nr:hypothetical protein RhiirA4_467832 [Rhizophagus irregularis]